MTLTLDSTFEALKWTGFNPILLWSIAVFYTFEYGNSEFYVDW